MCISSNEYKPRDLDLKIDNYDKLMELINSIKIYNGCDEVKLVGNDKSFEELMAMNFPLSEFKCEDITDFLDESRLYVIPIKKYDEYEDD